MKISHISPFGVVAVLVLAACNSNPDAPESAPIPVADGSTEASFATLPKPDPTVPESFVSAVGERVIICKNGPTHAGFWVTEGGDTRFVEVEPGRCAEVFSAEGATRTVEVRERVPAHQQITSVALTQLTCGKGVGLNCQPASAPVIVGPTAASNPVTGFVGGTGPAQNRSQWGLSGFVVEFTNAFVPGDVKPAGETVKVCLRGAARAALLLDDGNGGREISVYRGCTNVYTAQGATRTVSLRLVAPRGWRVAQTFQSQLTCGRGLGVECDPNTFPILTGPTVVENPTVGYVGGTGPSSNPSQKGLSGFVVEFFTVRN